MMQVTRRKLLKIGTAAAVTSFLGERSRIRAEAAAPADVVIGIGVDPVTLDPRQTQVTEAFSLTHVINEEPLFRDDGGNVVPYLCDSWKYTSPTSLMLHIRTGLMFENGEPLDAAAVKFTIESIQDPANTWVTPEKRGWYAPVDRIDAVDPSTLMIHTKESNHAILSYLTLTGVVPRLAAMKAGAAYGTAPSGTGPFLLANYSPGDRLEFAARKTYWQGSPAKSQKVVVRFLREDATRVAALQSGEVHVISNVPPDSVPVIKKDNALEILSVPSVRVVFVAFMPDRPPFNNVMLRRAVMYAVDREALVKNVLGGYGEVAQSVYAAGVRFFKPQKPYVFDPDRAKQLIKQSGFSTSQTLKFAYPSGRTINDKAVGDAVAQMLQNVGFKLEISNPEWGTFLDNYQKRRIYDFVIASMAPGNLDPDYALFPWFRSDVSNIGYKNPKVDALLQQGAQALDPATQQKVYGELQTMLWDTLPYAPLYIVPQLWARAKRLTGFQLRSDAMFLFRDASVS
jgi:peptide/nickel transport system substrate-binding protein